MAPNNATQFAIRSMLYINPLFKWIPNTENDLNVLAFGEDENIFEFIDSCLQAGQMMGHHLNLTVACSHPDTVKCAYLSTRPALPVFVNINGMMTDNIEKSYADLLFAEADTHNLSENDAKDRLLHLVANSSHEQIHYVFVSSGNDAYNRKIAQSFAAAANDLSMICSINYFSSTTTTNIPAGCNAVIPDNPDMSTLQQNVNDMAFNVHLCWKGFSTTDLQAERKLFIGSMNWESSVAFVMSIPYKLASFGILSQDAHDAAEQLAVILSDDTKKSILYELGALEHRRWVIDRVIKGWIPPKKNNGKTDYSFCVKLSNDKDTEHLIHPCLVFSTANQPLLSWTHEMWDTEQSQLAGLDELDRMSIELHRTFFKQAHSFDSYTLMESAPIKLMRNAIPNSQEDCLRAFDHYCLCLRNIIDGSEGYAKRYGEYEKKLRSEVRKATCISYKTIDTALKELSKTYYSAVQRNMHINYKVNNSALIEKIPFILTYRQPNALVISLQDDSVMGLSSSNSLLNVASITAIRPKSVVYLLTASVLTKPEILAAKLRAVNEYCDTQMVKCNIIVKVAYVNAAKTSSNDDSVYQEILNQFAKLHKQCSNIGYKFIRCCSVREAATFYASELSSIEGATVDGSNAFFRSPKENADFILGISANHPYFEYDYLHRSIINNSNCHYLSYIPDDATIRVDSMFALMGATQKKAEYPAFAQEYESLRKVYTGAAAGLSFEKAARVWNVIASKIIKEATETHGTISFKISSTDCRGDFTLNDVFAMLRAMQKNHIMRSLSPLEPSTTSLTTKVCFEYANPKFADLFEKEGNMLETYTYFEACKTGMFDDAISGLNFKWLGSEADNELDCVLSSGFQTIVIECKDRKKIESDFIHKIDSVASHFGLGTQKVLLLTRSRQAKDEADQKIITSLTERCKAMGVILLMGQKQLLNLGNELVTLIKEN